MNIFFKSLPTRLTQYLSLVIGLSCALAVLVYALERLDSERHIKDRDNIALVTIKMHSNETTVRTGKLSYAWADAINFRIDDVITAGRLLPLNSTIRVEQKSETVPVSFADRNLFDILPFYVTDGSQFAGFTAPRMAIVTQSFAIEWFGTEDIIGKTITVDLQSAPTEYEIQGVLEDLPNGSTFSGHNVFLPMNVDDYPHSVFIYKSLYSTYHETYLKLRPDTDMQLLAKDLDEIGIALNERSEFPEYGPYSDLKDYAIPVLLKNLFPSHLKQPIARLNAPEPYKFITIIALGVLMLFLAVLNTTMVTIIDLERRYGSLAIRRLVGGSIFQVITPDLIRILLNVIMALAAAIILLPITQRLLLGLETSIADNIGVVFIASLSVLGIVGFITLSLPILFIRAVNPALILSGIRRQSMTTKILRLGSIFCQISITTALITLVLTMEWQMRHLQSRDLGYDISRLYVVDAPGDSESWQPKFLNQLRQDIPGVEVATTDLLRAFQWPPGLPHDYVKQDSLEKVRIHQTGVSENFLEMMGARLLAGQLLHDDDIRLDGSATPTVINMTLAKALGWSDPEQAIGHIIMRKPYLSSLETLFPQRREVIIGVVRDLTLQDPKHKQFPFSYTVGGLQIALFIRLPNNHQIKQAREILLDVTTAPVKISNVSELYSGVNAQENDNTNRVRRLTYICVILSFIGVSGLIAQAVVSRQSSFALRYILGASWWNQITLMGKDVFPISFISMGFGAAAGFIMADEWLSSYIVRITGTGVFTMIAVSLVAGLITLASLGPLTSLSSKRILNYLRRG